MKLTGGYLTHRRPLVRVGRHKHTADLNEPISSLDVDAINAVQATPWRINTLILDTMMDAWTKGQRIAGLEVNEPLSLPERVDDSVWAGMPPAERGVAIQHRVDIHSKNATIMGRSNAIWDALSIAEELRDRPSIYYPHAKDFRGRIYPEATIGPQPQGSDISKALLHFAEGVPLGADGEFWLYVRAANTFGQDKLTLEERVGWTLEHMEDILKSALSPLTYDWWTKADEPWSFLATCIELQMVAASSSLPQDFVSHLPCPMDGTCNGLQHLAAMGLDPIGARATNLTPDPHRQDIYEEVAKMVRLLVSEDITNGVPEARIWDGKITRKVVKRSVMTTPYGVTDRGIRDQLIGDGLVPDDEEIGKGKAANYLKDKLVEALGGTVRSARDIMAWLQGTADRLAKAELPFDWTTPSGSQVRQGYQQSSMVRLMTLSGRITLFNESKDLGLNTRKQSLGAAPNFIHSFDAAHLAMTVDAASKRGITSFAMIHDSYGTHAGRTTELAALLRRKFVDIYRTDQLQRLYDEIQEYAPWVKIAKPPARGDFNIEQVLDAPYFFS